MSQTRIQSWTEVTCSTALAFAVSVAAGHWIFPAFGLKVSLADNVGITAGYTVISVIRSYLTRRFFNWLHSR